MEEINEKIKVGAVFEENKVRPKWFIWKKRKYTINEITFSWQNKLGEARVLFFSVTDGANLFELSLNQKTLEWQLVNIDNG